MPLPKPTLDNRRFDQLVGEGRALIPRLAPAWTDQNASDPGITLLELGAWLAEQNIFRFDRVSDEALRAFVRLVGIEPRMPAAAQAVVSIRNGNAAGIDLPPRMQLADAAGLARFETTHMLFASPALLVSVMTGATTSAARLNDVSAANAASSPFDAFGPRPRPGHALLLGFDRALDAGGATLSLHLWTEHWQGDASAQAALRTEHEQLTALATARCAPPDWQGHYRVRTRWEFYAGASRWLPLAGVEDETRALSLSGFVRFAAPTGHESRAPGEPFFIRCRIVAGRFECPPRLLHAGFNAVRCEAALSVAEAPIAVARGHAQAQFDLGQAPVLAGSVRLRLDDGAGSVQSDWREVPDFERAAPFDKVFALHPERGLIRSGDGLRAAILPARHTLLAGFRTGGGPGGNVEAGTLTALPASAHNQALLPGLGVLAVRQGFPATGGAVRETLASAQARAFDLTSAVDKAVTLDDIERLALATPGVPVARVRAVAGLDRQLPCYPAPGVVTLIVIPPCPRPAPLPSRALLAAVERHLDTRRLVTSEIHAIAPRYRRIGVDATLHLECEADPAATLRAAKAGLAAFLNPLDGGPDGTGWPFGRTVYRTEVMALLAAVAGVDRVTGLALHTGNAAEGGCDNVALCPHELARPGAMRLAIESDTVRHLKRSEAHEC